MEFLEGVRLEALTLTAIFREAVQIPSYATRTFALLTLALIFPLSFAILAHSLLTHPLLIRLELDSPTASSDLTRLLLYQFAYILLLFVFSLLSTAAVVFSVASLYSAKPLSFSSALAAIPSILPRLFLTFLWAALLITAYNLAFAVSLFALVEILDPDGSTIFFFPLFALLVFFLLVHLYVSALWHLACVVAVLEPLQGFAAMKKSWELLQGKTRDACMIVAAYVGACSSIGTLFRLIVVNGPEDFDYLPVGIGPKIVFGGALVAMLVVVNLIGLLAQSVFYYVCKSFHHQEIDRQLLNDHLGGYLGEYVPLRSSIQMETL